MRLSASPGRERKVVTFCLLLLSTLGLWYRSPATDSIQGWERESLPVGCGQFGANVFGGVTNERVQVTHNAVLTDEMRYGIGLVDGLEIRFAFPKVAKASGYRRGLDLETACCWTRYESDGVAYRREVFASYPDRVLAMRLTADRAKALEFTVACEAPFLHAKRTANVRASGDAIDVDQQLSAFGIDFPSRLKVVTDGSVAAKDGQLVVSGAREAFVFFSCDANYVVDPARFATHRAVPGLKVRPKVEAAVAVAAKKGYAAVRSNHLADYGRLFSRVAVEFGADAEDEAVPTDELVRRYAKGGSSRYLERVYFQYGRYLLIASSRQGCLPANLQGVWTAHRVSPWGSGYWHNINVQMNYWPAFSSNLAECFQAYADFNDALRPATRASALAWLQRNGAPNADRPPASGDLWSVGTGVFPYRVSGCPGSHSGPGTGGLTTKLFWDWWDFTRDRRTLERAYPVLHGMADFLVRCVVETNGLCLSRFSASPEQRDYRRPKDAQGRHPYYQTVGCAFDQQMIWENNRDFLVAHRLLGKPDDWVARTARAQLDKYDPVQIGGSGQIKEYREENLYGEIGEKQHRHISHLVGLMPGTLVNRTRPDWMEAARKTLTFRGDKSTGWALAHRLNAWARLGDGDHAYLLLSNLLAERTNANLWDMHPPFQIDGNFGATAGVIEMLLQSHAGFIDVLPALPKAWAREGSFRGLCARGAFAVDCDWMDGRPVRVAVRSTTGAKPDVRFAGRPCAYVLAR